MAKPSEGSGRPPGVDRWIDRQGPVGIRPAAAGAYPGRGGFPVSAAYGTVPDRLLARAVAEDALREARRAAFRFGPDRRAPDL